MKTRLLPLCIIALITAILIGCESDSSPPQEQLNSAATAVPSPSAVSSPTALPQPTATQEPIDPVTQQSNNIAALGRLYALVRYFHPSDEVTGIEHWDNLLMNGIDAVRDAQTPTELANRLNDFFAPIAPTVQVYLTEDGIPEETITLPPSPNGTLEVVMWEHYGVQADNPRPIYTSKRIHAPLEAGQIPENLRDPRQPYITELGSGLMASIPVSLFQDRSGTYPAVSSDSSALETEQNFSPQTQYIAANIMYWSVIRHFYPYLDVIDTDWDAVLTPAITRTLTAENELAMEESLAWLVAQAQDGHGYLINSSVENYNVPFMTVDWVENQLVIVKDHRDINNPLPPGTIVLKIDGEESQTRFERLKTFVFGATIQFREEITTGGMLAAEPLTELALDIREPGGTEETVIVSCTYPSSNFTNETRPPMIDELSTGIYYVDLTRIEDSDFNAALPDLSTAEGIIFDMRGYPKTSTIVLRHLITGPVFSAKFMVPQTRLPDQQEVTFNDNSWSLISLRPKFTDNIVFLTDGRAISYAETLMGIVEHYQLGEIVGQPTAGTNGDINIIELPTGHSIWWTGLLTLKQDGSQHHGVGIQPTHPVSLTIEGITIGRDEQLEAALALLKD